MGSYSSILGLLSQSEDIARAQEPCESRKELWEKDKSLYSGRSKGWGNLRFCNICIAADPRGPDMGFVLQGRQLTRRSLKACFEIARWRIPGTAEFFHFEQEIENREEAENPWMPARDETCWRTQLTFQYHFRN